MAIRKDNEYKTEATVPVDTEEVRDSERQTSISAHIVRTISVNMSVIEMDTLIYSFGRMRDELTASERNVQDEFVHAVEAIRF